MGLTAALFLPFLLPQQPLDPADLAVVPLVSEVVLAAAADPVPLASFGLGNGGLDDAKLATSLQWTADGCTTPGDIEIQCLAAGVKLTFPSGRELLVAPDGFVHLRGEEKAGPYPSGLELRLGDGTSLRISLAQSQRSRIREVVVVHGERALQPWSRGRQANDVPRIAFWGGVRICCCGDGGDLYRAVAIGSLIVLDRVLVPTEHEKTTPPQRLVVLTNPLLQSMNELARQHRAPDPDLRAAVTAVAATAARGDMVFQDGASLQRAEPDALRWVLRSGFELELALDGPRAPRLSLFAGQAARPMVEWTLSSNAAAFLGNPRGHEPGASRWHGNGVSISRVALELQERQDLFEHSFALDVIRRLVK